MYELGADESKEHEEIVKLVEELNLTGYTVGDAFKKHHSAAVLQQFDSTAELNDFLAKEGLSEKLILLKGSRGVGLEKAEEKL